MNLVELYQQIPPEQHCNIKIIGERVLVRHDGASIDEYLVDTEGELWLVYSGSQQQKDKQAIKQKLGVAEAH